MTKKQSPHKTPEIPKPEKDTEIKPHDPEEPLNIAVDDPDILPEDDPYENPTAYEKPQPGEGP